MPRVLFGLMFFPRGGSAHVTRALARELPHHGWETSVLSGSLTGAGSRGDARHFFGPDVDLHEVDASAALEAPDPLRANPPMHPSFEDRPGAPDRVFAKVDDETYEHLVASWSDAFEAAGASDADVLHLNHLTPLHEAAQRIAPDVPVVTHMHGTELLMLEAIAAGPPPGWDHAEDWSNRMRRWARQSAHFVLLSDTQDERVERELGIEHGRCTVIPNGFDPAVFDRHDVDRHTHWLHHLVEAPGGWAPDQEPGSVAYTEDDLSAFDAGPDGATPPTLIYVGRYTRVKRIPLLIRAQARVQRERPDLPRAPLVIVGGYPGEWEGEHPLEAIERSGARDVFLAGWHGHADLADDFNASDVVVLPSVREQFGQVLVEGMACGLPTIAVDAHGPGQIVDDGETGWLVEPDDEEGLAEALAHAIGDASERHRRGEAARTVARARYGWPSLAARMAGVYERAAVGVR